VVIEIGICPAKIRYMDLVHRRDNLASRHKIYMNIGEISVGPPRYLRRPFPSGLPWTA
jgi:hypothetical protein